MYQFTENSLINIEEDYTRFLDRFIQIPKYEISNVFNIYKLTSKLTKLER